MKKPILKVKRIDKEVPLPSYAHRGDAGLDLFSSEDVLLKPLKEGWSGLALRLKYQKDMLVLCNQKVEGQLKKAYQSSTPQGLSTLAIEVRLK